MKIDGFILAYSRDNARNAFNAAHEERCIPNKQEAAALEKIAVVMAQEMLKDKRAINTLKAFQLIESFFLPNQAIDDAEKEKNLCILLERIQGNMPLPEHIPLKEISQETYRRHMGYAICEAISAIVGDKDLHREMIFGGEGKAESPILTKLMDAAAKGRGKVTMAEVKQLVAEFLQKEQSFRNPKAFGTLLNALEGKTEQKAPTL